MEVSLEEAITLMKDLRIHDAKTMFAVQYLQLQKNSPKASVFN